jgi:TonB family protein
VALVDDDEAPPIITQPQTTSPVLFWMIIIITLTGSVMVGSVVAAFFYSSKKVQPPVTASPPVIAGVQKGTPVAGKELEGKVVSLPIAECPLNGQEAIPGTVVVRVTVSKTGQVTEAKASGGDWLLRGAASEAAMKSTFAPDKLRGHATEGTITYTFEP